MSTTLKVFSMYSNVKYMVEKKREIDYLNTQYPSSIYMRHSKYVKTKCEGLAFFINNGHFTAKDFLVYLLDYFFFYDKLDWSNITKDNILNCNKRYSEKTLKETQGLILELKNNINLFKNLEDLYRIDETDGSNILLELIKDNKITTYFYVKYYVRVSEKNLGKCDNKIKIIHRNCLYLYKLLNQHFECKYTKE